ncbi:MAG: hypothetical protein J5493_02825 [Lachnospiraceae bacterium]|nr:hypothetical protein [Lachnospiraceae bacterium]
MKLPFDPTEFTILMSNGYFGVSDDKLEEIAEVMYQNGLSMSDAAWGCDIDPANLSASDKAAIMEHKRSLEEDE